MILKALLLALVLAAAKPSPITLSVDPRTSFAPRTVRATVQIEYNERNDGACVVYDSEDHYSEDCWPLGTTRRTFIREYKDMPAGDYEFVAVVMTLDGKQSRTPAVNVSLISQQ